MQIDVSQLFKEPIGSTRQHEIDVAIDINGGSCEVQGKIKLVRTGRGMLVKGTLHTEAGVTCSRCLNVYSCPLILNIEEEYLPTTDIVSGTALPLPEEVGYFTIDECYVLDLAEAIHQYITLAIPMKPLCREDCAGICLTCGHNLSQGPCGCLSQEVNHRWSEVNKLKGAE